ncbi:MAG: response regulator, partial [Actinomycetota bacterium]
YGPARTGSVIVIETPTRILAVDDHASNLNALKETLAPLDAEFVEASAGEEALKLLLKDDFALILLDVKMPGLDGFATAEYIKRLERTRYIPIIFITGEKKDSSHVFRGYETGAVDYLVKPIDPEVLLSKASVFVQLYEKDRALRESEARFRSAFDNAPIGIALTATDGSGMEVNDALATLVGRSRDELGRGNVIDIIHPDDRAGVAEVLERVLSGAGSERLFEARCLHSDGRVIDVSLALSLISEPLERPGRLIVQIQDLSELRRAESYARELEAIKARQMEALEINDAVVQGLVVAKFALELGYAEKLSESLDQTLASAQSIVTDLMEASGRDGFAAGDLLREGPAELGRRHQ